SADRREDDDRRIARLVADAVAAAFKQRDDDAARRAEDAEHEPAEGEEGEEHKSEPEPMSADDDREHPDDSHDRHHRDDKRAWHGEDDRRDKRADALRRQQSDENDRLEAQYLLDQAFNAVEGTHAPKPISGQSCRTYQTYCLKRLQRYSDDYRDIDLSKLPA